MLLTAMFKLLPAPPLCVSPLTPDVPPITIWFVQPLLLGFYLCIYYYLKKKKQLMNYEILSPVCVDKRLRFFFYSRALIDSYTEL